MNLNTAGDKPTIAITSGEPAGIGPDLCVLLAKEKFAANLVVLGDRDLLASRATILGVDISALPIDATPLPRRQSQGNSTPPTAGTY